MYENQRKELLSGKIISMIIYIQPLSTNDTTYHEYYEKPSLFYFRLFIHPKISARKFYHIAIVFVLDNGQMVLVEYGDYTDTKIDKKIFPFNYIFSQRENTNSFKNKYHYLKKDGLRFIKIEKDDFSKINLDLMYNYILCQPLKNKTFKSLLDDFLVGWEAKDYIAGVHDCQKFAAKVILNLKAVRSKINRLRSVEKLKLPNPLIDAFYYTENDLSNHIGRIPIIGFFYDAYKFCNYIFNK